MSATTSKTSKRKERNSIPGPSNRIEPPCRRSSTPADPHPPTKRVKSLLSTNDESLYPQTAVAPIARSSNARAATPPTPAFTLADTPMRQSSSSRAQSRPTQSGQSSRSQTIDDTLPAAVADSAHRRTRALERDTMTREDMEAMLRKEIDLAVYEYPTFADDFLKIPESRRESIVNELSSNELFMHGGNEWSVDCSQLTGTENAAMHDTMAQILDIISRAAFLPDCFRPAHRDIVPLHNRPMRVDDPNDSHTVPDIIQAAPGSAGTYHWADVQFFAECKGTRNGTTPEEQISSALLQLARYARATLIHQIYRRHVFSIALYGHIAVFVRLGRTGIVHSPCFDLREDFQKFALAAAGLFALDANSFGYDTRFYFSPALTEQPDPAEPRKLLVKADRKRWVVLEIICQRKSLVGRATLVLRLCLATDRTQRKALKFIWREESRTDEGINLAAFKGYHGICQSGWSQSGASTAVHMKETLSPSPFMKCFYPPLPQKEVKKFHSSTSTSSSRSRSITMAYAKHKQRRIAPPEDRVQSVILMDEGFPLWQIQRLPHLLRVLRDGLVGLAAIAEHNKVHRDISEGNILCSPLRAPSTDGYGKEEEFAGSPSREAENPEEGSDTGTDTTDASEYFNQHSALGSDTTIDELNDLPLDPEDGIILAETYEEYVQQRYDDPYCDGRLYDLEFMVKQNRSDDEGRGVERTGTPAFISAQLLLATAKKPVKHTYMHDLESFFWVLVWMIATHTEPGAELTEEASQLIDSLCQRNENSLGSFKRAFLLTPGAAGQTIRDLDNGWRKARKAVTRFAEFLKQNIYEKENYQTVSSDDEDSELDDIIDKKMVHSDIEPWPVIKAVIDIFDKQISRLLKL